MSLAVPRTTTIRPSTPPLQAGDCLSREEFERRLEAMPETTRAELIEGRVYVPPPVFEEHHGSPHMAMIVFVGNYWSATPGVIGADNTSVRLDLGNLPQPDVYLRIGETHGGRTCRSAQGYIEGAPELIAEVAASSVSYDLHDKLQAYQRNGVNEYIVWRTYENTINWFALRDGQYALLDCSEGIFRSQAFPGLWLDSSAMLRLDLLAVLKVLQQGLASQEHQDFIAKLASATK